MHNPIQTTTYFNRKASQPEAFVQPNNLGIENQGLGSCTLSLISNTLSHSHCKSEASEGRLQQLFKKWQHTVDLEVPSKQIAKALKLATQQWLELQINESDNPLQRNARAHKHFLHIKTSIGVLNLARHPKAIRVLHYLMIHPVRELSSEHSQTQSELFHTTAKYHYHIECKPNYSKIANKLFVREQSIQSKPLHRVTYLSIGMTFGLILGNILAHSLFGACIV